MFFGILGTLLVEADGPGPVAIPGAKERLLLARLLICPGHAVAVETLVEDVWDRTPPPTARKSLQAHVVRLRSALEPDRPGGSPGRFVVRRGDGYAIVVDPDDIDARVLTSTAASGRAALASGAPDRARRLLTGAEALWRGDPLADWPDADWAAAERTRLTEVRVCVLQARLDAELALGRHREVVPELEALVTQQPLHEGWWTRLMLALYRSDRQSEALAAGRRARAVLVEELGLDAGPGLRGMEHAILRQDESLIPSATQPPTWRTGPPLASQACPYRGLAAYRPQDAAVFCGRGAAVRALISKIRTAELVVVSGPSGAGKSSLVRAGLLPALAAGAVPGSQDWGARVLTPGPRPVDSLAPLLDPGPSADPHRMVVVVDQFEELWTAPTPLGERTAYFDALLALLDDGRAARIVLVCRGDHLGRLSEYAPLAGRAGDGMVLVPPLTEAEIREVVEGPAAAAGLDVDPDLVAAAVTDVYGQASVLPLLSSALTATWERRRDSRLTLVDYLEAGGVTGAMARTAEDTLASLDQHDRRHARHLLVRLAADGDAGAAVRRRVPLGQLGEDPAAAAARREVVEAFVARRLLTIDAGHLEVTHEALFTAWPRLAGWLAQDAAHRRVRNHLAPEARDWVAAGRPGDRLYRGARLAAAQDWLHDPDADASEVEREFVTVSTARSENELRDARAQTERERAGRRRVRRLASVLAVATALAAGTAGLAVHRGRVAQANARRATANRLAAASAVAPSLDLSLLLAAEGFRTERTPQTEDGLLAAAVQQRHVTRVFRDRGLIRHIALSPDGRTLYAHADLRVVSWDLPSGKQHALLEEVTESAATTGTSPEYPSDVDASATGEVAVVRPPAPGVADSSLVLLAPDGDVRWTLPGDRLGGSPMSAEFSSDGARLVVEVMEGYGTSRVAMRNWSVDPASGTPHPLGASTELPGSPIVDPYPSSFSDGAGLAVAGLQLDRMGSLDLQRSTTTWLDLQGREISGSNFLPVQTGLFEADVDGTLYWFPRGAARAAQELHDHTSQVYGAATDATGTLLVTGGADGRTVVHDLVDGTWVTREVVSAHRGGVLEVAVSRDGRHAYTTGLDRTVIEVDLTETTRFGTLIPRLTDPDSPQAHPLVLGEPALAGTPPVWVLPVMTGSGHNEDPRNPRWIVAAFIDPTTAKVLDWIRLADIPSDTLPLAAAATSPDGRLVAITAEFATVVIDTRTHRTVATIRLDQVDGQDYGTTGSVPEPVTTTVWTPDGSTLLLGTGEQYTYTGRAGAVVVVDTRTWRPERRVLDGASVYGLDLSQDGRLVAVGSASGEVVVLETPTLRVVHRLRAHGPVLAVALSPDGSRLAAAGFGKRLDVWDLGTEKEATDPPFLGGAGFSLRWLPDGNTVVYGGDDGRVVLFDVPSGSTRGVPLPIFRDGGIGAIFLAPTDGRNLAVLPGARAGSAVREGVTYPLDPSQWLAGACEIAHRDFTTAEWRAYLPDRPYRRTCTDMVR